MEENDPPFRLLCCVNHIRFFSRKGIKFSRITSNWNVGIVWHYRAGVHKLLTFGLSDELAWNWLAHSWAVKGSKWRYTEHCNRVIATRAWKKESQTKIDNLLIVVTHYTPLSLRYTNVDTFTVCILSQLIFFQGKLNTNSRAAINFYEGCFLLRCAAE